MQIEIGRNNTVNDFARGGQVKALINKAMNSTKYESISKYWQTPCGDVVL